MSDLTVDASVWVAAADPNDRFYDESQNFLAGVQVSGDRIVLPAFARVEVACALARKLGNPLRARQLSNDVMALSVVEHVPLDADLLERALFQGTGERLRGADALYAATASLNGAKLVSWDNELIERAGGLTPTAWLDANP
jgi:predicted nucleic acid-binding protein